MGDVSGRKGVCERSIERVYGLVRADLWLALFSGPIYESPLIGQLRQTMHLGK